ncbi:MAG: hypothetical protein ACKVQS_06325 [Fimbriimonadaceae bacterium]
MDWFNVVQVWLVVCGAILLSGAGGLLVLSRRVEERKDLFRFIGLLLVGMSAFILLVVAWQLFVLLITLLGTYFLFRWIGAYFQFRVNTERRGFKWKEVVLYGNAHCIGFSKARQAFFEMRQESEVEISFDDLDCYYFIGRNSEGNHQFVFLNGEFVLRDGEVAGFEHDFSQEYRLVIEGGGRKIESPPMDVEELLEFDQWMKEKVSLIDD